MHVLKFYEGSYFGEFYILNNAPSQLSLIADSANKKGNTMVHRGNTYCQIYELTAEDFLDLCSDYPRFRNTIAIRAEIRHYYIRGLVG